MRKLYFASFLCLLTLASRANETENFIPGQLVRADGSRISTLVRVPLNADEESVVIKDETTGEDQTIRSNDIRSITVVVDGKTIQYIHTAYEVSNTSRSKESVWLQTISWGEITLYKGEWNAGSLYFMKTEGMDVPMQIHKQTFKTQLIPFISDYVYLTQDLENGKYSFAQLNDLMDEYNSWKSFE
jgi:hypothetical protein